MNNTPQPPCPECVKLAKVHDQSQPIGEFLDWLRNDKGYVICDLEEHEYEPVGKTIEQLLAEYFEIDLKKVEQERRVLLEWIRSQHEA